MRDLAPAVNAILDATEVGDGNVVIDGHVNPRYGIYLIFDTSTREFVQVFPGTNLIWRDSDITTAVYQYENDILDYAGHILGRLELEDGAFIHDLAFGKADGQDAILLTIFSDSGERQEELPLLPLILGEFEDILGLSGWYQEEPGSFRIRTYYTRLDGETVPIAESWGFEPDDHPLDLDGDGVGELVCNCVYGGDGVRTAIVYRRNGDVIEKGELQPEFLPEWSDEVPLQYHSWYQEEDGTFHLQYLTPGADAAEQIHTLADLTFEPYRFLPAS